MDELKAAVREAAARRRDAERALSEQPVVDAALAAVRRDLEERSSPELRVVQQRLDHARDRLLRSRSKVDHVERMVHDLSVNIDELEDTELQEALRKYLDPSEMVEFREAIDRVREQRVRTDAIGQS